MKKLEDFKEELNLKCSIVVYYRQANHQELIYFSGLKGASLESVKPYLKNEVIEYNVIKHTNGNVKSILLEIAKPEK